jgi:hypothetical protein
MIQFFALIPRIEGVSSQEFHDHWRHPHGTMGRMIPTLRSYVQAHQIHIDLLGSDQAQFEGIAESTFDTVKDAMEFGEEPYYKKYIQPDEPNFVDVPRLEWLNTEEEVLVPRARIQDGASYADALWLHLDLPLSIQLLQFIRRDGNPQWAGNDDIELGRRIGALRHVRNYPSKEIHGDKPPYLGVRQLWWPTLSAFEAGVRNDRDAFNQIVKKTGSAVTLLAQAERFLR